MHWDLLIHGAKVFDGTANPGEMLDVAVKDGHVVAKGANLPREAAAEIRDATGNWLIPGLLDIHTHEDLEVELEPGLPEVVRHGTTSVIVGNCSIGLAFGNQRRGNQDPIVDCFARVENIPKPVLRKAAEKATWGSTGEYLQHLNDLPLAANLAPLVPHSMLRIEVMGLDASVSRDPTSEELERMVGLLERTARDVATAAPRTIRPDRLAKEALGLMNTHKITCLFVADGDTPTRPVGILHVHDCLRTGVDGAADGT